MDGPNPRPTLGDSDVVNTDRYEKQWLIKRSHIQWPWVTFNSIHLFVSLLKCDFLHSWRVVDKISTKRASRGPSAIAEPRVRFPCLSTISVKAPKSAKRYYCVLNAELNSWIKRSRQLGLTFTASEVQIVVFVIVDVFSVILWCTFLPEDSKETNAHIIRESYLLRLHFRLKKTTFRLLDRLYRPTLCHALHPTIRKGPELTV